jgi:hypothetical protein
MQYDDDVYLNFTIVIRRGIPPSPPAPREDSSFTQEELDAIAPQLTELQWQSLVLRGGKEPPEHVKRLMAQRIAAARLLKEKDIRSR